MKVLIACEESQAIVKEMRRLGHEAYSCDIQEAGGGHPEWHIMQDVLPLLNGFCRFKTQDGVEHYIDSKWDLLIAHPPCTHLAVSGARHFEQKRKDGRQQQAIDFFLEFTKADCPRIAIENPVCIMSSIYRKPDQYIQPYEFGDAARKKTAIWLIGDLKPLTPTNIVDPGKIDKHGFSYGASLAYARDENGKILPWNDPRTAKIRSRTYPGIAKAIAEQWAGVAQT